MADRIAGETGHRRRPIRHVASPDRMQREQVVECKSEITAGDEQCRERDVAPIGRDQGLDDLAAVDIAQNAIEHQQCNREDGDAEHNTDPIPADLLVAKSRAPTQNVEDPGLAIRLLRLHWSTFSFL